MSAAEGDDDQDVDVRDRDRGGLPPMPMPNGTEAEFEVGDGGTHDKYLFTRTTNPDVIDMARARSDARAAQLLALRDMGEHPSEFSTASSLMALRDRAEADVSGRAPSPPCVPRDPGDDDSRPERPAGLVSGGGPRWMASLPPVQETDPDGQYHDQEQWEGQGRQGRSGGSAVRRASHVARGAAPPLHEPDHPDPAPPRAPSSSSALHTSTLRSSSDPRPSSDPRVSAPRVFAPRTPRLAAESRYPMVLPSLPMVSLDDDPHDADAEGGRHSPRRRRDSRSPPARRSTARYREGGNVAHSHSSSSGGGGGRRHRRHRSHAEPSHRSPTPPISHASSAHSAQHHHRSSRASAGSTGGSRHGRTDAGKTGSTVQSSSHVNAAHFPPMAGGYKPDTPLQRKYKEMLAAAAARATNTAAAATAAAALTAAQQQQQQQQPSTAGSAVESSVSHPGRSTYRREADAWQEPRNRDRDRERDRDRDTDRDRARDRAHDKEYDRRKTRQDEVDHENKIELLIELEKLRCSGVELSFRPNMDVPLWQLRHEYEQHEAQQTLLQRVGMVKSGLKLFTFVTQSLCSSFLKLDGWSQYVHDQLDTGLYDSALEQIYRSLAGKGRPNPWLQVAFLVLGTAIAYHIDNLAKEAGSSGAAGDNGIFKIFNMVAGLARMFAGGTNKGPSHGMRPPPHTVPAAAATVSAPPPPPAPSSLHQVPVSIPAVPQPQGQPQASTSTATPVRRVIRRP